MGTAWLRGGHVHLLAGWPPGLVAVVASVLLGAAVASYMLVGRRAAGGLRLTLAALRAAALLVAFAWALHPMLRMEERRAVRPALAILLDTSASMARVDRRLSPDRREAARRATGGLDARAKSRLELARGALTHGSWLRELARRYDLHLFAFADGARELEPPVVSRREVRLPQTPAEGSPSGTQIGEAISQAADELRGRPAAGILLLTDGANNGGQDPVAAAAAAKAMGAPVHAVCIGDPVRPPQPKDVAVADVVAPQVVRANQEVTVAVTVTSRGYPAGPVRVALSGAGRTATKSVVVPAGGSAEAWLPFTAPGAGDYSLTVSAPARADDVNPANNRKTVLVRAVRQPVRVLMVEGEPRWEYRYIKNALLRDRSLELSILLRAATRDLGPEGNREIYAFPETREKLYQYDVILLGDVGARDFTLEQLSWMADFVSERGGGLILVAGEAADPQGFHGSPLERVIPVEMNDSGQGGTSSEEPFRPVLTPAGREHPITMLGETPEENERAWAGLEGQYWCYRARRAKPGATVLVVHPTLRAAVGNVPLMAVQQYGAGKVFISCLDSTWRWRVEGDERYFYRFWGQTLRWMAPKEVPGAKVHLWAYTDRRTYAAGQDAIVTVRALDRLYRPMQGQDVVVTIERDGGQVTTLHLTPVPGRPSHYSGVFRPPSAGRYAVRARLAGYEDAPAPPLSFEVRLLYPERDHPEANEELLRAVARAGGGRAIRMDELSRIPTLINRAAELVPVRWELDLWDSPLLPFILAAILGMEWALRKRKGMP